MATIVVSIICIAMIIVGGMTLSQGILTSADRAALSVEDISIREGELNRTSLENVRAAQLSWGDFLRITVQNTGQTKLANFDKWDVIVHYYDESGTYYTKWLPYTESEPGSNEWQLARIGLNGPTDFFEPGILNPSEEMIILANIDPVSGNATVGDITVSTANGVYDSISFSNPSYTLLTPHSESTIIACTGYYEIAEATPADGPALTYRQDYANSCSIKMTLPLVPGMYILWWESVKYRRQTGLLIIAVISLVEGPSRVRMAMSLSALIFSSGKRTEPSVLLSVLMSLKPILPPAKRVSG
jgi:hypothetical protein